MTKLKPCPFCGGRATTKLFLGIKVPIDKWLNTLGEAIIGQYYFELLRCIEDTPTVIEAEEE